MQFAQAIRGLGQPQDWREAVLSFVDEHGRGASRWIAQRFGVSQRTAQRWIKGTQAPGTRDGRREAVRKAGNRNRVAARALRNAQAISVGRVKVVIKSSGKPDGTRGIGTQYVDEDLKRELEEVAQLLDAGDITGAEAAMSDALLGAYAASMSDNREAMRSVLAISEYPNGIEVS